VGKRAIIGIAASAAPLLACGVLTGLDRLHESAQPSVVEQSGDDAGDGARPDAHHLYDGPPPDVYAPPGTFVLTLTIDLTGNGNGGGEITATDGSFTCTGQWDPGPPPPCAKAYPQGTKLVLTAQGIDTTWDFLQWYDDCTPAGAGAQCAIVMDADKSVAALFQYAAR
jgi:hypothetical protein